MFQELYELFALALAAAAVGAFAGVASGVLGVGGGVVLAPALYAIYGALGYAPAHLAQAAVGAALGVICLLSARALVGRRAGIDWRLLSAWAPFVAIGAALGALLAANLASALLAGLLGAGAAVIAARIALSALGDRLDGRLGDAPPTGARAAGFGVALGGATALFGLGGGAIGAPLLQAHAVEARAAGALAAGFGAVIGLVGAVVFALHGWRAPGVPPLSIGYVNLVVLLTATPVAIACAPVGVRLAQALDRRTPRLLFALFLGLAGVGMVREALLGAGA